MCGDRHGRAQERDLGRTHPIDTLISDFSLQIREERMSVMSAPTCGGSSDRPQRPGQAYETSRQRSPDPKRLQQ